MHVVPVWIEADGPRPRYAAEQVLGRMLGWSVRFVDSAESLQAEDAPGIAYSRAPVAGAFHIPSSGWLLTQGHAPFEPETANRFGVPVLFPIEPGHLPFDLFAATFYCLSRWEEYDPVLPRDAHGRPVTSALFASRHGYLKRPLVDEWAMMLASAWRQQDQRAPMPQRAYRQVATIDLDNGLKYLGRPLWRALGSWGRDALNGRWHPVLERLQVVLGLQPDPFELDEPVLDQFNGRASRTVFFVLTAERGKWDHAVPVSNDRYRSLLRRLAQRFEIGLHPSYRTSDAPGRAIGELAALEEAIARPVRMSRQHFLRMRIPGTLRERCDMGMSEEHSMGLHDQIGFRASTSTPFNWYDLERDEPTSLVIHPFAVMDSALARRMRIAPENAVAAVAPIIDEVKRVKGTFTGLWHESFLARTGADSAWRKAVLEILDRAQA